MSVPFSGSPVEGTRCASSINDIACRAAAYDVPAMVVDGMDVVAVYLAVKEAVARARQENQMSMIECKTYRWYGHSRNDPREYRTKDEEKAWHERDPITVLRSKPVSEGHCTEQELDQIKDKAFATIETATQFALNSPLPNPADVDKDVYVPESYPAHMVENAKSSAE
jgi:pyruvate dehydrogenase E1 component alpha subunit